jgi:hypothetical protein
MENNPRENRIDQRPGSSDAAARTPGPIPENATGTAQEPVLRVLALDSGPQSTTLLLLSVQGDIPPFDLAIFADRAQDRPRIFAQLARVQQIAVSAGVPILHITTDGTTAEAIRIKIREILGYSAPRTVPPSVVAELALPVSLDEVHRATDSDVPYLKHTFPLLDLGWTRRECEGYLRSLRLDNTSDATRKRRGWTL